MPIKNKIKFLLITSLPALAFFFFIIPNANAATYPLYALPGSGYIVAGVLRSIASVVAEGGFSLILRSVVLIGFLILFIQMLTSGFKVTPHKSTVRYFAAVVVIYAALLVPKVTVQVYSAATASPTAGETVSNVPWGIGYIASIFSQFQYYMTTSFESGFSTPNSIDLTNAGMGFQLTSQNLVDGAEVNDPYLFQSFTQYVYNCVLPGISAGGLSSEALSEAGGATAAGSSATAQSSLLAYTDSYTTGAGANFVTTEFSSTDPTGATTTCSAQATDINTSFANYTANSLGPEVAGALGLTDANFLSQFGLVNSSIYNMSSNATGAIEQMAVVNQYDNALIASANLAGVNPTAMAYGSALARQNMNSSFAISGQLAGEYMPVVYGLFFSLFLAFSLILIILMALPIGANYLKMYAELGLFLAIWPVLMAVYNYIDDLIVTKAFGYQATMGYSLDSAHSFNMLVGSQLGWMGYLSWGVPIMAYALVSGSTYAMVSAIGSMDSAGKSAAAVGAQTASTGNLGLGNDSLNTFKANDVSAGNRSFRNLSSGNVNKDNKNIGNTVEGSKAYASNTATGNDLLMGVSSGALNSKNFHGAISDTGGQTNISGQVTRQGLENMVNGGNLTDNALTQAKEELHNNPNAEDFSMTGSGTTAGGFSTVNIQRAQSVGSTNTGIKDNKLSTTNTQATTLTVGDGARSLLSKTTPLGSVTSDITGGKATDVGGVTSFNGLIDRQGLKKLAGKGGLYGNTAGAKAIQQYLKKHPHQNTFGIDATGNKKGLSNLEISKNRSGSFTTNGNQSNYWTLTNGKTKKNLENKINDSSTQTVSGTKNDIHLGAYNYHLGDTTAMLAFASKSAGSGGHLNAGQLADYKYYLDNRNPGKAAFVQQNYDQYAKTYGINQTNANTWAGKIEGFLNAHNKGQAGFTVLGTGDKFVVEAGGKVVGDLSYNQVNAMKVNQLNESVANGDFKNVHNFTGLKGKFNKIYHNNQPVENQIVRWAENKVKGLNINSFKGAPVTHLKNDPKAVKQLNDLGENGL